MNSQQLNSSHSPLRRVTHRQPCEVCGKSDWCSASIDGARAICMRVRSDKPTRNNGYLHILRDDLTPPARPLPLPPKPKPKASDVKRRAAVYGDLLDHLTLDEEHHAALRARGLSDLAISEHGYRSTPGACVAASITRALACEHDLTGVPGFYRHGDGWRLYLTEWFAGFFIPVRDTRARVRGLMIRRNDGTKSKYVWLSSKDKPDGASPGSPPSFARVDVARATGAMTVSEGALKSSIISELTGEAVCGIAGVSNFKESFGADLRRALPELRRVVVAYDADFRTNDAVKSGMTKLRQNLSRAGLSVSVRIWDASAGKGLDDVLVSAKGVA